MAKIDAGTEEVLRKVLYAAIKEDKASFEEQLDAFPTDDSLIVACSRATDIAGAIIAEQYKGRPTPDMITRLADYVASMNEKWTGISASNFEVFISSMLSGQSVENALPLGVAVRLPFVLAAHLMIQFKNASETGFDYLDRVWDVLEARN